MGVASNVYLRKTLEKPKEVCKFFKRRVQEFFMHRDGISTPCARHKGQQPLIESVKRDFKIIYFPKSGELLFFYLLSSSRREVG